MSIKPPLNQPSTPPTRFTTAPNNDSRIHSRPHCGCGTAEHTSVDHLPWGLSVTQFWPHLRSVGLGSVFETQVLAVLQGLLSTRSLAAGSVARSLMKWPLVALTGPQIGPKHERPDFTSVCQTRSLSRF